ncbi:MAG: hypothetical protein AB7H77_11875 [Bdellovibrionales bacterium]
MAFPGFSPGLQFGLLAKTGALPDIRPLPVAHACIEEKNKESQDIASNPAGTLQKIISKSIGLGE